MVNRACKNGVEGQNTVARQCGVPALSEPTGTTN